MTELEQDVFLVFLDVLQADETTDVGDLKYNEFEGWDSVGHMAIVAGLEERFDCMFEMEEILDMSNFSKAVEIITKHNCD
jgi:acyl carrier protein